MRKIGFIAGQAGEIVKYDPNLHAPKPVKLLTRHQRATLYFKAVRFIEKLFRDVGFNPVTMDSHGSFVLELGQFMLEMKVEQPPPMAHVTSYSGYVYDRDKINAKVTFGGIGEPGEYVIRVIATLPNMRTIGPIYVTVSPDSTNPLREAFLNALNTAKTLISRDPNTMRRIAEALASRNIENDFDRFQSQDAEQEAVTDREQKKLGDRP